MDLPVALTEVHVKVNATLWICSSGILCYNWFCYVGHMLNDGNEARIRDFLVWLRCLACSCVENNVALSHSENFFSC